MTYPINPVRIAVFASGQGSNAREIIRYFNQDRHRAGDFDVRVSLICCNKTGAGVLDIAADAGIPVLILERDEFFRGSHYLGDLASHEVGFIVLAGFLWKIPPELVTSYPGRIINIHPSLLPKYGGKGMYGQAVHAAVLEAGDSESGISIHNVDEQYDNGSILFQARCPVLPDDSPESLSARIHVLEHQHFPPQIARWIETKLSLKP